MKELNHDMEPWKEIEITVFDATINKNITIADPYLIISCANFKVFHFISFHFILFHFE